MLYEWLKITHVISAALLFGTGMGTAFYMFYVNQTKNISLIAKATKQVVFADWLFTGSSGVIQFITGFYMIFLKGYSFASLWIYGSIIGYFIAGACWLPVVWLQIRCAALAEEAARLKQPLSPRYHVYFKTWCILGIPAFLALTCVFYLMTNRPVIY